MSKANGIRLTWRMHRNGIGWIRRIAVTLLWMLLWFVLSRCRRGSRTVTFLIMCPHTSFALQSGSQLHRNAFSKKHCQKMADCLQSEIWILFFQTAAFGILVLCECWVKNGGMIDK